MAISVSPTDGWQPNQIHQNKLQDVSSPNRYSQKDVIHIFSGACITNPAHLNHDVNDRRNDIHDILILQSSACAGVCYAKKEGV